MSDSTLLSLAMGRYSADQAQRLVAMVDGCPDCEILLDQAAAAVDESAQREALSGFSAISASRLFRSGELLAGRYRTERVIGCGGMGLVYEARDLELDESVALKVIHPHLAGEKASVARLRREVRLARRIAHPNVCRILEFGCHQSEAFGTVHFLTMELLRGDTLLGRLEAGAMSWAEAVEVARQVALGLEAVHREGVLHRDIKPGNIFLCSDADSRVSNPFGCRAVLLDFGIARGHEPRGTIVTTQGVLGTPEYMAPEQMTGDDLSPATDVYAIGLALYEMLTGARPFRAKSPAARAYQRIGSLPPAPRECVHDLPEELDRLVLWCLAREPAERPQSARELHDALVPIAEAMHGNPSSSAPEMPLAQPSLAWRRRRLSLAGSLALAACAGTYCYLTPLPRSETLAAQEESSKEGEAASHTQSTSPGPDLPIQDAEPPRANQPFREVASKPSTKRVHLDPASTDQIAALDSSHLGRREATPAPVREQRPQPRAQTPEQQPQRRETASEAASETRATRGSNESTSRADRCSPPYYYDTLGVRVYRKDCI